MSNNPLPQATLLNCFVKNILPEGPEESEHLGSEVLALLSEGALNDADRDSAIEHIEPWQRSGSKQAATN